MKGIFTILIFLAAMSATQAQDIQWTKFENLNDSLRIERKPLMIFIETEWCKYCAMQNRTTFTDAEVIDMINSDFYALRLNAQHDADIRFLNRTYSYSPTGEGTGFHSLAEQLAGSETVYPSTVFFNASLAKQGVFNGYVDAQSLIVGLKAVRPTE